MTKSDIRDNERVSTRALSQLMSEKAFKVSCLIRHFFKEFYQNLPKIAETLDPQLNIAVRVSISDKFNSKLFI